MSTKSSIKWRGQEQGKPAFDVYEDALDDWISEDGSPELPVYLRIVGVPVQLQTLDGLGVSITMELPREMARALGLLPQVDCTLYSADSK